MIKKGMGRRVWRAIVVRGGVRGLAKEWAETTALHGFALATNSVLVTTSAEFLDWTDVEEDTLYTGP